MSWEPEVEELRRRERLAEDMGGEERVARQRSFGKMTVRDRIQALIDPGSLHEVGKIAGSATYGEDGSMQAFRPANMVFGRALIEGRPVVVLGDDFTVRGGAADASIGRKMMLAEQIALEWRMPMIRIVDGTGGGGSVRTLDTGGRTYIPEVHGWHTSVASLGAVPVCALALGPCAGLGAARVAASHYSVMVKGLSQVFAAGPPLVAAIGETVTKEELGGWEIHAKNGVVDDAVESEADAFIQVRRFLSYLPSSIDELSKQSPCADPVDRRDDALVRAIPESGAGSTKCVPFWKLSLTRNRSLRSAAIGERPRSPALRG